MVNRVCFSGVLWRGSHFLPGVIDTLKTLSSLNKKVFYCTNSSTRRPADVVERFTKAGLVVDPRTVYTSSSTTAAFLELFAKKNPSVFDITKDKVFVIGYKSLLAELRSRGFDAHLSQEVIPSGVSLSSIPLDRSFRAVVVGLDPDMSYAKCAYAVRLIRETNALFISTNQDATYPAAAGVLLPGAGSCVSMVATSSGRAPLNMGKPSPLMMDAVVEEHGLTRERTLMVGDRRDTDVTFGNTSGMHSMLVFTGVTSVNDFSLPCVPYQGHPAPNVRTSKSPLEVPVIEYANSVPSSLASGTHSHDVPTYVASSVCSLTCDEDLVAKL